MRPEWHIEYKTDENYLWNIKNAKEHGKYIKASISKETIGYLLQGRQIVLLFLNDDYEVNGMLDIELSDEKTVFEVSEELNQMIVST